MMGRFWISTERKRLWSKSYSAWWKLKISNLNLFLSHRVRVWFFSSLSFFSLLVLSIFHVQFCVYVQCVCMYNIDNKLYMYWYRCVWGKYAYMLSFKCKLIKGGFFKKKILGLPLGELGKEKPWYVSMYDITLTAEDIFFFSQRELSDMGFFFFKSNTKGTNFWMLV